MTSGHFNAFLSIKQYNLCIKYNLVCFNITKVSTQSINYARNIRINMVAYSIYAAAMMSINAD